MKNVVASISCLEFVNKITSLFNELLYSQNNGFLNTSSKQSLEMSEEIIKKFELEASKIQTNVDFVNSDILIKNKKNELKSIINSHCQKQTLVWLDEVFDKFVDNLLFELSINKEKSELVFENLINLLNWYSDIKNLEKDEYNLIFSNLKTRFDEVLKKEDFDYIPMLQPDKSQSEYFFKIWNLILENFEEFISLEFDISKLSIQDLSFFENIKNKLKTVKKLEILDEIYLINSAVEITKIKNTDEIQNFICQIISDFNLFYQNNKQILETDKIELIKRRIKLFEDKNKTTKEYFKKLIIS